MFIVVDANELSQHMVRLASPFTVLVQRSLRSPMPIHDRILETTTAFVGSLCRAVSQYQHAYVTERVLAVIWFIVTLVYDSGNLFQCHGRQVLTTIRVLRSKKCSTAV